MKLEILRFLRNACYFVLTPEPVECLPRLEPILFELVAGVVSMMSSIQKTPPPSIIYSCPELLERRSVDSQHILKALRILSCIL